CQSYDSSLSAQLC
nr:immunoglobulin light chain junction region [Macaca mulatta]